MQHSDNLIQSAAIEKVRNAAPEMTSVEVVKMIDRTTPRWAIVVAISYVSATTLIYLAVSIAPLFLFNLVAVEGQLGLAPILVLALLVPLTGTLLIDFCYRWSLSGLKDVRTSVANRASGIVGLGVAAVMAFIQPFFLVPVLVATGLASVCLGLVRRFDRNEGAWEFKRQEATSFLSGRDDFGFNLANKKRHEHSLAISVQRFGTILAGLGGFALGSWLVSRDVLTLEAVASLAFISMLVTDMMVRAVKDFYFADIQQQEHDTVVRTAIKDTDDEEIQGQSDFLQIQNLNVLSATGEYILEDISLDVMPGSIVQITGSSGDGKTMLLRALSDPFGIQGCEISGQVTFSGLDFWDRRASVQSIPAVRVDACPLILPASALDNMTCFHPDIGLDRARTILRKIVYSQDVIEQMTSAEVHAPQLPLMQQKVLGLVRAFLLSPQVILLDSPEAFLPEQQIGQVVELLKSQARLGRVALVVTDNRTLMDACDKVLVLQGGRAVDFGDGTEIRARHGSGWRRFTGVRRLETEEALHSWLRSQFIRNGDEGNRRRVCKVGSNILAHFCMSGLADDQTTITFECKQKAGAMELRASDDMEPISTIQFEQAKQQLVEPDLTTRLSPLAQVIRDSQAIQTESRFGQREIHLEVETYDPRKRAKADK